MSRERRQGLLPFEFTPDEDDAVTSWSGLTLLVDLMRQLGLPEHARSLGLRERASGHDEFQLRGAEQGLVGARAQAGPRRAARGSGVHAG
jgi:hypothetical protein